MRKVKKIVIYGDSISTGTHGEGAYLPYLEETYGAELVNYAVGGSGLCCASPDNGVSILEGEGTIPEDADLIILWHGSNDWYWGSPMGELEDKGGETFLGAIGKAVRRIREKAPEAALLFCTPIYRFERPDGGSHPGRAYEMKNKLGYTLTDYCEALRTASVYHGFPLADMRRYAGIHEGNQEEYLEDRVHPNGKGYERIWRVMKRKLDEVLYYAGYGI